MAEKKNQHFVPQFILRNFSDINQKTINIFNLKRANNDFLTQNKLN